MKTKHIASNFLIFLFAISSIGVFASRNNHSVSAKAALTPPFQTYTNHDGDTYYNDISDSLEGADLLNALRTLNNKRKKASGGYKPLLNGNFLARWTDYDPTNYELDVNNQPYSNTILSFYSGNKSVGVSGMNREHVWPDSRGGNLVEADTHMARPTLTKENSSRGNSFYVEGMESTSAGWDPAMPSFGDETYRGDSARIIFYCVVANSSLSLVDKTYDSPGNKTMGKLSHLLKWNLNYLPQVRETNRNEGTQYIQGNRNPFIDHPEYACRIWGDTNDETRKICNTKPVAVTGVSLNKTELTINDNSSEKLTPVFEPSNATNKNVTWSSSDMSIATVSATGLVSGKSVGSCVITVKTQDGGFTASCNVTVKEAPVVVTSIEASDYTTKFELYDPYNFDGKVVAKYSNGTSKEVSGYVISSPDMTTEGYKNVTISYTEDGVTVSTTIKILVGEVPIVLKSIEVTDYSTEVYKNSNYKFDGIVTATYSDLSTKEVTPTEVSKLNTEFPGKRAVTITYSENGVSISKTIYIMVLDEEEPKPASKAGCSGNITATSVLISALSILIIGILLINKIRYDKEK